MIYAGKKAHRLLLLSLMSVLILPQGIRSDAGCVANEVSLQQFVLKVGGLQSGLICKLLLRNWARSILYSFRPL
jgi:hypothetical protein